MRKRLSFDVELINANGFEKEDTRRKIQAKLVPQIMAPSRFHPRSLIPNLATPGFLYDIGNPKVELLVQSVDFVWLI